MGKLELIEIFKKAGKEQGLVGLKPIAILKGKDTLGTILKMTLIKVILG